MSDRYTLSKRRILCGVLTLNLTLTTTSAFAACDMNDDGDCCVSDSDCGSYFHPALCAVVPLNKLTIARIEKEAPKAMKFCSADSQARLKSDAESKIPICLDGICEFKEDNG
jgi:hypothetical protein